MAVVESDPVASDPGRHGPSAKAQVGAAPGCARRRQPDSLSRTSRVTVIQSADQRQLDDLTGLRRLDRSWLG